MNSIAISMVRANKGTVVVRVVKGRLRLVWTFGGERRFFSLGLSDTKPNQAITELKAKQIERDIAHDLFDPSLKKYRPDYQKGNAASAITIFQRYTDYKTKTLRRRSLEKYHQTLKQLEKFYGTDAITEAPNLSGVVIEAVGAPHVEATHQPAEVGLGLGH